MENKQIKRTSGFYWVKKSTRNFTEGLWQVALFNETQNEWTIIGSEGFFSDDIFAEIKEKPLSMPF